MWDQELLNSTLHSPHSKKGDANMQNEKALARINEFRDVLNSQTIKALLHNSLKGKAGAFASSMIDLYSSDYALQSCDPEKVALECVKAAVLDLPIVRALGYAYIVPYNNIPTFVIGYKGLIQLAQRSGQYNVINADMVYEGELTGSDKLSGMVRLDGKKKSDTVIGYFAYFKLLNGYEKMMYTSRQEMTDFVNQRCPSAKAKTSPWKSDFDKMACKTVLKQLIGKYGPTSLEMQKVLAEDNKINTGEIKEIPTKQMIDVVVDEEEKAQS